MKTDKQADLYKRFMVFILVLVVSLAPLNAVAHEVTAEFCQDLTVLCGMNTGAPSSQSQDSSTGDCCDSEKCSPEAEESLAFCYLRTSGYEKQFFYPDTHSYIPTVYLAIFVPPER
ncbi:MAG: hypothetical protein ACYDHC_06170 [Desulfuromonadaceae bacterium]